MYERDQIRQALHIGNQSNTQVSYDASSLISDLVEMGDRNQSSDLMLKVRVAPFSPGLLRVSVHGSSPSARLTTRSH